MGRQCSTQEKDEKCIQNFDMKTPIGSPGRKKGKGVPLHAMEAHGGRGGIAYLGE
jgi:hypothetical protein